MPKGQASWLVSVTLVLGTWVGQSALADDGFCQQSRTSLEDRQNILDTARGIARQRRLAPDTFQYCTYRRLRGQWDWATVETTRRRLKDESETWLLVDCSRRHGKWEWNCVGRDRRSIRVSVADETGTHDLEVQLGDDDKSRAMDATVARLLVLRTVELANQTTETVGACDRRDEQVHPRAPRAPKDSWDLYNAATVSTDGVNHWSVGSFRDGILSFVSAGERPYTFRADCWSEGILVLE